MAKEQSTQADEVIVQVPQETHVHPRHHSDTKTVVVAVGVSVVLFVIGLILGYLLGHQNADTDERRMMNGSNLNTNGGMFRNRIQTQTTAN
ncbi:MAG: hypothetical protein ABIP74_04960 [Candidatus Saccharimonas sp.]